MYLINSILQLFLLNILLGHRGHAWMLDIDIIRSIFRYGNPLLNLPYFPRVALCDVFIREISDIHRYTVQCALPFNMLNEKIFLGLSFWFSYVVLHNLCSFVILIYQRTAKSKNRLCSQTDEDGTQHWRSGDGTLLSELFDIRWSLSPAFDQPQFQ
jgi:Innexin